MLAYLFLPIRPRADMHLLNGLAAAVIREGWVQEDYVREHTAGYESLKAHVAPWTLTRTAELTGLTEGQVYEAARTIGTSRSVFFAWTMGVNHSTQGTDTVSAINNLALLTGNVGIPGGSAFSITGQCNAMGSREASFTSSLPGYRKFEDPDDRRELARLWGVDVERIPTRRGLAYPDIVQAVVDGKVKALWIIATNPLVSYPDQGRLRAALQRLEFLAVQDGYHPTATSELAHLVFPAAIWGEKEGTYTNSERRVSKVNPAAAPPGEARPDLAIFLDLAERLGVRADLFPGWEGPRQAFEEWRRVSRGRPCDYSGMTYERLADGPLQWPATAENPAGSPRLYADGRFATADGKAVLRCLTPEPLPEGPDADYPFILNTGRTVEHWHTRTKTGKVPLLESRAPEAWVELNPADAARLDIRNHDRVSVLSRRGRLDGVQARVTATVAPGQVFIPFHFAEQNVNHLTIDVADPVSREPNYKQSAVRVEKVKRRRDRR
jgi:assimilatory nitrate reductase catalytic subunit